MEAECLEIGASKPAAGSRDHHFCPPSAGITGDCFEWEGALYPLSQLSSLCPVFTSHSQKIHL